MPKRISPYNEEVTVDTFIEVRFTFEGTHFWSQAPEEVDFLRVPHRHLFNVRARMSVRHDDREKEFFIVQRALRQHVATWGRDLGPMSCEMMAKNILMFIWTKLKSNAIEVEVNEDGENGAIVSTR